MKRRMAGVMKRKEELNRSKGDLPTETKEDLERKKADLRKKQRKICREKRRKANL